MFETNFPNDTLYLFKYAQGATAIGDHKPGTLHFDSLIVANAIPGINKLISEGKTLSVSAIWYQGESDTNDPTQAANFPYEIDTLVNAWRDTIHQELPVIFTEIANDSTVVCCRDELNAGIRDRSNVLPNFSATRHIGFKSPDGSHIDYASMKELGNRYFTHWLRMGRGAIVQDTIPVKPKTLPVSDFDNDPIPVYSGDHTDTTINLAQNEIIRLDLTSYSTQASIAFIGAKDGGRYTIAWENNSNSTVIEFPSNFFCVDGTNFGNFNPTTTVGTIDFYYDGNSFYISSSQPSCTAGYQASYQALLDYYTVNNITAPSDTLKDHQNLFIKTLEVYGITDTLDVLYISATEDQRQGVTNWIDPTGDSLSLDNGPTFKVNEGFESTGGGDQLIINFRGVNGVTKYVEGNQGVYYYISDSCHIEASDRYFIRDTVSQRLRIINNYGATTSGWGTPNIDIVTSNQANGFFAWTMNGYGTSNRYFYDDSGLEVSHTYTAGSNGNLPGGRQKLCYSIGEGFSFLALGGHLSATGVKRLRDAFEVYRNALGITKE